MSLVLVAVMAALVAPLFQEALRQAGRLPNQVGSASELVSAFERITEDYETTYGSDLAGLRSRINQSPSPYGTYTVLTNAFMVFNGDRELVSGGTATDILKVTLGDADGQRLSAFYPYQAP